MKSSIIRILACGIGAIGFFLSVQAQITVQKGDASCGRDNGWARVSVSGYSVPPYHYQWSNGSNSDMINGLKPGKYSVTVTDNNGCSGVESVKIINDNRGLDVKLKVALTPWTKCMHASPEWVIWVSVTNGVGPYSYYPKGPVLLIKAPGKYGVTVWDADGCRGRAFVKLGYSDMVCGRDPNAIYGPVGFGEQQFCSSRQKVNYVIYFENDPEIANAPAKRVAITHRLDSHINIHSLRLGDFGFAGMSFQVPPNSSYYQDIIDLSDSLGIFVEVTAGLNVVDSTAFWIFQSIDPGTGLPPDDPMVGLLPVNDTITNRGTGYVYFNVLPLPNTVTGDTLNATANIVFDINPPVFTNTWFNTADAFPPVSQVSALPSSFDTTDIEISFTSQDDYMGSGVGTIDLFVSTNGQDFVLYGSTTADSNLVFTGDPCTEYYFYSIATDNTGNEESLKTAYETRTILKPAPVYDLQPLPRNAYLGDTITFTVSASGTRFFQWEISMDDGQHFSALADDSLFSGTQSDTLRICQVPAWITGSRFRCIASNNFCFTYSEQATLTVIGSIHGSVRYDNLNHSPMSNTEVYIKTEVDGKVDSVFTNSSGYYFFETITPGDYLTGFNVDKAWGGVNATDALLVLRHFTYLQMLDGFRLMAADVNNSQNVNAVDALLIAKRFAQVITGFESGDWILYEDTAIVTGSPLNKDFTTLCYGDVNGTYVPEVRMSPSIALSTAGEKIFMPGNIVELPFSVSEDIKICAMSLILKYPSDKIRINDIVFPDPEVRDRVIYTNKDGMLRIAWYSTDVLVKNAGEPVFVLSMEFIKIPDDLTELFVIEDNSEFANCEAKPTGLINLVIPELKTVPIEYDKVFLLNYPNPFADKSKISFYLPEQGTATIKLYSPVGAEIMYLTGKPYQAGWHTIDFDAPNLASGTYYCNLDFIGSSGNQSCVRVFSVIR